MPTTKHSRLPATLCNNYGGEQKSSISCADWRCLECGKLLGVRRGAKLHVRVQGHDYTVSLPAEAICRGCGTHNRT
ncbi:hypothetical protein [Cypionkella psychrotolerans]|uniref:hypothetical protein n=1 Tax=Cypionkella psychrotolerans TaxID=1678131 RepID=UPI0006B52A53|nr:hypothetical protein [Cypionkella psychrotolerans]